MLYPFFPGIYIWTDLVIFLRIFWNEFLPQKRLELNINFSPSDCAKTRLSPAEGEYISVIEFTMKNVSEGSFCFHSQNAPFVLCSRIIRAGIGNISIVIFISQAETIRRQLNENP